VSDDTAIPVHWISDDSSRISRFDLRALTAICFLAAAGLLCVVSLLVPGYVRHAWLVPYCVIALGCLMLCGLTAWAGYLSGLQAAAIIFSADLAIVLAGLGLADRDAGRLVAALFTLPSLFISVFMTWRWLALQTAACLSGVLILLIVTGDRPGVIFVQALVLLVAALCPAVIVLLLRAQLDRAMATVHEAATRDPLTGLYNRRGLDEQASALLGRSRRAGLPVGVLVADVDHFKRVNDLHGHAVGDQVLRRVASAAVTCVRVDDLVVRLGGEELAVVCVIETDRLHALAERLRASVEDVGEAWGVTVSVGVAWRPPRVDDDAADLLWSLLDIADDRMYEAKRGGRNQVRAASITG
jgi:diguanylate cyclase (GGDEF)-like protein